MKDSDAPHLMKSRQSFCPACNLGVSSVGVASVVSPWVLELAEENTVNTPRYRICPGCGSGWFGITYAESILSALYKGYRGEQYFKVRNSWEPSYTVELNAGLNNGASWLAGRRSQITKSLTSAGALPTEMESVLDFGGGHGGVMPNFPRRYLLEANESVVPEPGIVLVREWEHATPLKLDLTMCCGVLEHVNNPHELVEKILELNSNYFLFEVPTGTPVIRTGIAKSAAALRFSASHKIFWRNIQRLERKVPSTWRKFFPLRCSEHLQFFTPKGLRVLLEKNGLEVLELTETTPNNSLADAKNLGFEYGLIAVCRKISSQGKAHSWVV